MYDPPLSSLDVANAAFVDLIAGPNPVTLDGNAIGGGLPARPLRLDELRSLLLSSSTPYDTRDAVLAELLRRSRDGDDRWLIGLVGIMLPGLRNVANRLTRNYPGDPDCIDAAVLAGFIEAALGARQPPGGLAVHLLWAAYRGGREIWLQEMRASTNGGVDDAAAAVAPAVADHIDLVLAGAVQANRITAEEAELIAATRIERIRLGDLARRLGVSHEALKRRRQRAEARLVTYLCSRDPDLSRFRRNRGLRECGTPRGGRARSSGQCDRRQPSTTSQPEKEVSKPRTRRPRPPRVPAPADASIRRSEPCDTTAAS